MRTKCFADSKDAPSDKGGGGSVPNFRPNFSVCSSPLPTAKTRKEKKRLESPFNFGDVLCTHSALDTGTRGGGGTRRSRNTLFIRIRPTVSERDERVTQDGAAGGAVGQARGCQTPFPCYCHAVSIGQKPNGPQPTQTTHDRCGFTPNARGASLCWCGSFGCGRRSVRRLRWCVKE